MTMTTRIACAAIAATLGVGTAAQARDWGDNQRDYQRDHQRNGRQDRAERFEQRQHQHQRYERDNQRWSQPQARTYSRPYAYSQPAPQYRAYDRAYDRTYQRSYARPYERGYNHYAPQYRSYSYVNTPRYWTGGYVPQHFRAQRYWVNDWHARNLYAPPYGYQWVETDTGDVLLMALATGLIASVILSQ